GLDVYLEPPASGRDAAERGAYRTIPSDARWVSPGARHVRHALTIEQATFNSRQARKGGCRAFTDPRGGSIAVSNALQAFARLAEHATAFLLAVMRNVVFANYKVRTQDQWDT